MTGEEKPFCIAPAEVNLAWLNQSLYVRGFEIEPGEDIPDNGDVRPLRA